MARLSLAGYPHQPRVIAIPKATSREHQKENLRTLDLERDEKDVRVLDAMA